MKIVFKENNKGKGHRTALPTLGDHISLLLKKEVWCVPQFAVFKM